MAVVIVHLQMSLAPHYLIQGYELSQVVGAWFAGVVRGSVAIPFNSICRVCAFAVPTSAVDHVFMV